MLSCNLYRANLGAIQQPIALPITNVTDADWIAWIGGRADCLMLLRIEGNGFTHTTDRLDAPLFE
jgi:hypothetical protein